MIGNCQIFATLECHSNILLLIITIYTHHIAVITRITRSILALPFVEGHESDPPENCLFSSKIAKKC